MHTKRSIFFKTLIFIIFLTIVILVGYKYKQQVTTKNKIVNQITLFKKEHPYIKITQNKNTITIPYCIINLQKLTNLTSNYNNSTQLQCNLTPYKYLWIANKYIQNNQTTHTYENSKIQLPNTMNLNLGLPKTYKIILLQDNIQSQSSSNSYIQNLPYSIIIDLTTNKILIKPLLLPDKKIKNYAEALNYLKVLTSYYRYDINLFYKRLKGPAIFECNNSGCKQSSASGMCAQKNYFNGFPNTNNITKRVQNNVQIRIKDFYTNYCSWLKKLGFNIYGNSEETLDYQDPNGSSLETLYFGVSNCESKTIDTKLMLYIAPQNITKLAKILYMDKELSPYDIPHTYLDLNNISNITNQINIDLTISVLNEAWWYYIITNIIINK